MTSSTDRLPACAAPRACSSHWRLSSHLLYLPPAAHATVKSNQRRLSHAAESAVPPQRRKRTRQPHRRKQPTLRPQPYLYCAAPRGVVSLWHSWSQTDGDALARILEDFNQMYPEVQVETLFVAYNDLLCRAMHRPSPTAAGQTSSSFPTGGCRIRLCSALSSGPMTSLDTTPRCTLARGCR